MWDNRRGEASSQLSAANPRPGPGGASFHAGFEAQSRGFTMNIKQTKVKAKAGAKVAAALAGAAGKKVARRLAEAGDAALMKLGEGARQRKRTRALKKVGKAALVTSVAAATVLAGRALMKRKKG